MRGDDAPLSMCRRVRGLLPVALLLTGCHSAAPVAPFTATGYIADGGIVRLWRLEGRDISLRR
ncbi:hypothetical protein O0544_06840 [Edwardsiella anguillarum]|nr:hypothetical protein [Edwardsiella anguillarum]